MPQINVYVRFKEGWSAIGFAPKGWDGRAEPENAVYISQSPTGDTGLYSDAERKLYSSKKIILKKGVYPLTIGYSIGVAHAMIAGQKFDSIPAPTVELPLWIGNIEYYPNWWDVPEHREATISTVLPTAIGVGLIKFIK